MSLKEMQISTESGLLTLVILSKKASQLIQKIRMLYSACLDSILAIMELTNLSLLMIILQK